MISCYARLILKTLTGKIAGNFYVKRKKPKKFSDKYGDLGANANSCTCLRLSKEHFYKGLLAERNLR